MTQGGFKRISVTPAEEDDIVINAGIAKPPEAIASDAFAESDSTETNPTESELEPDSSSNAVPEDASGDVGGPGQRTVKPTDARRTESSSTAKRDAYHEATLQDLQSEPMSLTQKVVIIAAVLCIIGALVYYFAFLR